MAGGDIRICPGDQRFLLVVITSPEDISGEAEYLERLLEAGLQRLHIRKPGGSAEKLSAQLRPKWGSKVVIHGNKEAASKSVHSWEELMGLPPELEYAFLSPLFDSISKPGYAANAGLLRMPPGPYPCRPVGLGGVNARNLVTMIGCGWTGAAVLGWIWEDPKQAVRRFEQLKHVIDGQAESIGGSGI